MKFSSTMVVLLFLFSVLHSSANALPLRKNVFAEYHLVPEGSSYALYLTYRIEYGALIFVKSDSGFTASYTFAVERTDTAEKFIARDYSERKINVKTIAETKSDQAIQGILKYSFSGKKEKLLFSVFDRNADHDINRYHFVIQPPEGRKSTNDFFVVEQNGVADLHSYKLANFNGILPFSEKSYSLLVLADSASCKFKYLRAAAKDSSFLLKCDTAICASITLDSSAKGVQLQATPDPAGKNWILLFKSVNRDLYPASYSLSLTESDTTKKITLRPFSVIWLDKPRTTEKLDYAYKIMDNIEKSFQNSPYYKKGNKDEIVELLQVWKPYDPTPLTSYNERMAEFFARVDYSLEHFSTLKGTDGAETDRGEMYIRLGAPSKTERSTTKSGKIAEIWTYDKLQKDFIFIDVGGNGAFDLKDKK